MFLCKASSPAADNDPNELYRVSYLILLLCFYVKLRPQLLIMIRLSRLIAVKTSFFVQCLRLTKLMLDQSVAVTFLSEK